MLKIINIWIVEDDTVYRRSLRSMLKGEEYMNCTRVFPSCIEFFEALRTESHPDLVLMDLGLPGMGGVEGIKKLSYMAPEVTVLVLTVFSDKDKVMQALEAGASGYLLKSAEAKEIVDGIIQVYMGNAALTPSIAKLVLSEIHSPKPIDHFNLSEREIDVLERLASGLSVKEIAADLKLSRSTAAFHLRNIYEKLDVQSQSGAVAKALRSGVI